MHKNNALSTILVPGQSSILCQPMGVAAWFSPGAIVLLTQEPRQNALRPIPYGRTQAGHCLAVGRVVNSELKRKQKPKSVYLIEYNCLAGKYLRDLLKPNYAVKIIRCSHDGNIVVQCRSNSFFLIDAESLPIRLPVCVHWISCSFREARILVIGTEPNVGMHGIISPREISKINTAIESVMSDHLWIRHEILERFARYSPAATLRRRNHSILTPQEGRIVAFLQQKYSNKEIGGALGITERTVKFHLANILHKVGAHDRSSALDLLLRASLVHVEDTVGESEPGEIKTIPASACG
jgi:DNA-binding CsgD family transcriptional regulator